MSIDNARRRSLRFAGAWFLLPLACGVARAADPFDVRRLRGENSPPREPGYGAPAGPARPAPGEVHPPKPGPIDRRRREPGWRPSIPLRRPKRPPALPKPGVKPPA